MRDRPGTEFLGAPKRLVALIAAPLFFCVACEEMSGFDLGGLAGMVEGPPSESQVAQGLKQALTVGTDRATSRLSAPGGFADNPKLRLGLPEEVQSLASALRIAGLGGRVDELELKMNEAAEMAAGEAVPVFTSAILSMSIQDAFGILNGGDNAATSYFEARTSGELRSRFSPVVDGAMSQVGVYRSLQDMLVAYRALPFSKPAAPDLSAYITDTALSGLFQTLSEEETRIREDPAARSTQLLRQVFGSVSDGYGSTAK